jgi:hypothetical protein
MTPLATVLVLVLASAGGAPKAADSPDAGCARVLKALENVVTTPAHVYTTEQSSKRGETRTETIYLDGKVYVRTGQDGRWTLSPVTAGERIREQRRSRQHATIACTLVGKEKVADRAAAVYTTSRRTGDSEIRGKLWIDEASGLLLRQEEDLAGEKDNTVHRSSRYEYGNVAAPKID